MKKSIIFLTALTMSVALCACTNVQNSNDHPATTPSATSTASVTSPIPEIKEKNTVVVLATGGTIAGSGEAGNGMEYKAGTLTVESLLKSVPQLKEIANIEAIQICNTSSPDLTSEIWIDIAKTINELSKNPNVSGFVITHGTDTMEETAYFLNLTVKTDKPVVLTGSMRPATSISADGPMNLYQAVCVANAESAVGKGVLVVFSDKIYSARSVMKTSTYHVMAISAGETGSLGVIRGDEVYWYETPAKLHTMDTEFDISNLSELPKVAIVYFNVDADPEMLRYVAEHADGIVIAGAGAGSVSDLYMEVAEQISIPIVLSSRIGDGIITQGTDESEIVIAANNLPPQKAAVLLRLALTKTSDPDELVAMFSKY